MNNIMIVSNDDRDFRVAWLSANFASPFDIGTLSINVLYIVKL